MKICAISDIHGNLLVNIPECDVLCICGDIINLNDQRNIESSRKWWYNRFSGWVKKQKCDKVIVIPGNHDFLIEHAYKNNYLNELKEDLINRTNGKLVLLVNESYTHDNTNFYGCPFIRPIMFQEDKWAFASTDINLYKIPENTDILLTHDNPYKNKTLQQNLPEHIKFHFYGHWHNGEDNPKEGCYNCSILNDFYNFKKNYNYVLINFEKNMDKLNKIEEIKIELDKLNEALESPRTDENSVYLDNYAKLKGWLEELVERIAKDDINDEDLVEWNTNMENADMENAEFNGNDDD